MQRRCLFLRRLVLDHTLNPQSEHLILLIGTPVLGEDAVNLVGELVARGDVLISGEGLTHVRAQLLDVRLKLCLLYTSPSPRD